MDKRRPKPLISQYRLYACMILAAALLMTGSVSYFILRGMYMDRRDQSSTETLMVATDKLASACDGIAYRAAGIYAYLEELIAAYCGTESSFQRFDYYRKITESFNNSIYASESYSRSYSLYLVLPDSTQMGWPMQQNTQGSYFLFDALPRHRLDVDLPAGSGAAATFWVYENQASFNNVLFFALEVPAEKGFCLIVVGVRPETVFTMENYGDMALALPGGGLLRFSPDSPFEKDGMAGLPEGAGPGDGGRTGSFDRGGQSYIVYGKVSSHLGSLLLAVPVSRAYPLLRPVSLGYASVGVSLFLLFWAVIWRLSPVIVLPLSRLSTALEQNDLPLSRPVELPGPSGRLERWMGRYSIRSRLMLFFIAGSVVPALFFLIFCTVVSRNIIARTHQQNIDRSIANMCQTLSQQLETVQEIGKSIIFLDETQALMLSPPESEKADRYRDSLTRYLLFLQPDVSHTNTLFINVYNLEGVLLYSTHNIFSFSDDLSSRAGEFVSDRALRKQWFYESVGNTSVYSYYRKAYKKSVDPQQESEVPVSPAGFPQIGYLQVGMLEPTLRNYYSLLSGSEGIECMILDGEGTILSSMDSHLIGLDAGQAYPGFTAGRPSLFRYAVSKPIAQSDGWSLYVLVEDRQLMEANLRILFYNSYVLLAALGLILLFTWLILTKIKHPLNHLLMLTQQRNVPKPYVYTGRADEVSALVGSFNRMLERLQEQIDIRHAMERQKQEVELIALQSQINPHFLYNVFTSISFTMLRGKTEDAANMLDMVGRLFRTGIYRGHPIVAMEEEIRHVKTYLDIQLIRYSHKLTVGYDLDPAIYEYRILKLTLQPLVENSIYHGIEIKEGPGSITISARVLEDRLQFTIRDDGVGIRENELCEIQRGLSQRNLSRGIGLNNVNERIKLYFGDQYGLVIESIHQGGTCVVMTMPLVNRPIQEEEKPCIPC